MTTFFHGGVRGLRPGEYILPPTETAAVSIYDTAVDDESPFSKAEVAAVHRRDRVYLSSSRLVAEMFAALHPDGTKRRGGDVYIVQPIGELEADLDYQGPRGDESVQALRALIVGVAKRGVRRGRWLEAMAGIAS